MVDVNVVLAANRAAIDDLIAAAERSETSWTTPRAPGKWSPSQIVEHVARTMEESANEVYGAPSKLPTLPMFLRPLFRVMLFNRVLKKNAFPRARTSKSLNPASGSATPAEARVRLGAALAKFDQACHARGASGENVVSTTFGRVSVNDYARFQELHTRHHCKQMADPR